MPVSIANVQNLLDFAAFRGIEIAARQPHLPKGEGIERQEPDALVPDEYYFELLSQIAAQDDDPHWGLRFGTFLNLQALGLIAELSLHSDSLMQVLALLKDYLRAQFSVLAIQADQDTEYLRLMVCPAPAAGKLRTPLAEMALSFMYREVEAMLDGQAPIMVKTPRRSVSAFQKALGTEVWAGDQEYEFLLPISVFDWKLNRHRLKMVDILLPQFLALLHKPQGQYGTFTLKVRQIILQMSTPFLPSADQVIAQFPMSARTFQRHLRQEGSSFRKLTNQIKKELYHYLSIDEKLSFNETASLLGYADASALAHAKAHWSSP